jgi:hypothetical protein
MARSQAIVQLLGIRSQGDIFGAWLTDGTQAQGPAHRCRQADHKPVAVCVDDGKQQLAHKDVLLQGKALWGHGQQGGQQLQVGQARLRRLLPPAPEGAGEPRFAPAEYTGNEVRPGGAKGCLIRKGQVPSSIQLRHSS